MTVAVNSTARKISFALLALIALGVSRSANAQKYTIEYTV